MTCCQKVSVSIWSVQSSDVIGKDLYSDVITCVSVEQ